MYEEQKKIMFTKITQVYKDFLNMSDEEQLSLIFNKFEKPFRLFIFMIHGIFVKKLSLNKELNKSRKKHLIIS